jgi:hypothetical protein
MSAKYVKVEVEEVLKSAEVHGEDNVLAWDPSKFNDSKQKNKKAAFDYTYIHILFKRPNGEEVPLNLRFKNVVIASAAKPPSFSNPDAKIKNLTIAFRSFDIEELEGGDYAPKDMPDDKAQATENKKARRRVEDLIKNTRDFNRALEIIDISYIKCCEEMKDTKNLGFSLRKEKKKRGESHEEFIAQTKINSLRQLTREDKDKGVEVDLKHPITRIKLMVSQETGIVGYNVNNKGATKFVNNVYDVRKLDTNNKDPQHAVAMIKVKNKLQLLNVKTAKSFITYKSRASGTIEFNDIMSHKFGLSLMNKFKDLYINRYKSTEVEPAFSKEDIMTLRDEDEKYSDVEYKDEDESEAAEGLVESAKSKRGTKKSVKKEVESDSDLEDEAEDTIKNMASLSISKKAVKKEVKKEVKSEPDSDLEDSKSEAVSEPAENTSEVEEDSAEDDE